MSQSAPRRMATRAANANTHPGCLVRGPPRCTSEEVALEKQRKTNEAKEKAHQREKADAAKIQRIAEVEQDMADQDAADNTPKPISKTDVSQLRHTKSYLEIAVATEDFEDMTSMALTKPATQVKVMIVVP